MNRRLQKLNTNIHWIFIIFFGVGVMLFSMPQTRQLFFDITPLTLTGLAAVVLAFHRNWNAKVIFIFAGIFVSAFFVEMAGVKTGHLFGEYIYQTTLGPKIGDVPIIIGLNWLIVAYGANSILRLFVANRLGRIFSAALLMVLYDVVMEFAAPVMVMWTFDGYPPIENFVMWFVLGLVYQLSLEAGRVNTDNRAARALFVVQTIFFLLIWIIGSMP